MNSEPFSRQWIKEMTQRWSDSIDEDIYRMMTTTAITIDTTYGDISQAQAIRMARSVLEPGLRQDVRFDYPGGATEIWVSNIVVALLKATGIGVALETGAFRGHTTTLLAQALRDMGGGTLYVAEMDTERAMMVALGVQNLYLPNVEALVSAREALAVIHDLPDQSVGLAFLDDDHTKDHVAKEIEAVWPKMASGGIVCFHDVFGVCDLQSVVKHYGGYSLDFPRCGPAGGLGILQVR